MKYTATTKPDIANRLMVKAGRLEAVVNSGAVYDVEWREVFLTTASLFTEAAKTIETQGRDLMELREQLAIAHEILAGFGVAKTPQL